jgi:hypothetical protein
VTTWVWLVAALLVVGAIALCVGKAIRSRGEREPFWGAAAEQRRRRD